MSQGGTKKVQIKAFQDELDTITREFADVGFQIPNGLTVGGGLWACAQRLDALTILLIEKGLTTDEDFQFRVLKQMVETLREFKDTELPKMKEAMDEAERAEIRNRILGINGNMPPGLN